jgi:hypothetical protein
MGTACWSGNEDFDCAWVSFGFGSCYDLMNVWISLPALKALTRLDNYPMHNGSDVLTEEEHNKLSPMAAYLNSSIFIDDSDDKAIEWFQEIRYLKKYYEKNPDKVKEKEQDETIKYRIEFFWKQDIQRKYWNRTNMGNEGNVEQTENFDFSANIPVDFIPPEDPNIEPSWYGKKGIWSGVIEEPRYIGRDHKSYNSIVENGEYKISYLMCIPENYYVLGGISGSQTMNGEFYWARQQIYPPSDFYIFGGLMPLTKYVADSNQNSHEKDPEMNMRDYQAKEYHRIRNWELTHNWRGN